MPEIESGPLRLSRGPLRFGETYLDQLNETPNIDLQLNTNAIGFEMDDDNRITGVEVADLTGDKRLIKGNGTLQ